MKVLDRYENIRYDTICFDVHDTICESNGRTFDSNLMMTTSWSVTFQVSFAMAKPSSGIFTRLLCARHLMKSF